MRQLLQYFIFVIVLNPLVCKPPKECPDGKYFSEPDDCQVYYQCDHGRPVERKCGAGTVFNKELNVCDHPDNVKCEDSSSSSSEWSEEDSDDFWDYDAYYEDSGNHIPSIPKDMSVGPPNIDAQAHPQGPTIDNWLSADKPHFDGWGIPKPGKGYAVV